MPFMANIPWHMPLASPCLTMMFSGRTNWARECARGASSTDVCQCRCGSLFSEGERPHSRSCKCLILSSCLWRFAANIRVCVLSLVLSPLVYMALLVSRLTASNSSQYFCRVCPQLTYLLPYSFCKNVLERLHSLMYLLE